MFRLEFDPPDASPRLAIIYMDKADEKVNTFAPEDLEAVEGLIETIEGTEGIVGAVIISGKTENFVAGADVETFARATDRRQIEAFSRRGHAVLRRLETAPFPVVAAIHGAALGAGLELALACNGRVCTDHPKTVLGVPEVSLGLFPGAGGLARLPRLIGLRDALDMILTGRRIRPRHARKLGLVDELVAPGGLLPAARARAIELAQGKGTGRARERDVGDLLLEENPVGRAVVFRKARSSVDRKTMGLYPAPYVALDLLERGASMSLEAALALEPPAFAELAVGEVSRSLVYLFRSSNAMKGRKVTLRKGGRPIEAHPVSAVGIVGGGFMGADIAVATADGGMNARIRDIDADALAGALDHADSFFDRRARKVGRANVFRSRSRVSGGLTLAGFQTFDLIIEAVPEILALKQDVFSELEQRVEADVVLASNTSALPIGDIARELKHRDRVLGLHFFSPVPRMPLVEIVRTEDTAPWAVATALEYVRRLGKTPLVVQDGPGFYTTRVLGFYLLAALEMVERGHSIQDVDRGARKVGWPVGPLALMDEVGIDVGAKVVETLAGAFPGRIARPPAMDAFLSEKRLGRKSGRGFYFYSEGEKEADGAVYDFFPGRPDAPSPASPDELGERLTLVAALEAVRCLEDKVIACPRDGDVGAVFGFGYPAHRGGPFHHLDLRGPKAALGRVESFADRFGARFAPPELLRELAQGGGTFSEMETGS